MPAVKPLLPIPEETRREIFEALVAVQDKKVPVRHSRDKVASQYGISYQQVKAIEEEGLDNNWPPL